MATRIKNFFSRKPSSKRPEGELVTSSYDSAKPSTEPILGAYPVAGNGPHKLGEYTRGRAVSMKKRLSISSATGATKLPKSKGDSKMGRPVTAPHSGVPAAQFEAHQRTQFGFSTTAPPNFSRKPNPDSLQMPVPEQIATGKLRTTSYANSPEPVVQPVGQELKPGSNVRAKTASPESEHSRSTSAYVDLLEAASTINPTENTPRQRTRASGRRDYGEDVADRNIADFGGVDLSSPQFSYLSEIYVREKTHSPGRNHQNHRRDNSAWHHIMGEDGTNDYVVQPKRGQTPIHSRNVSAASMTRPTTSARTSSLTSASIREYGVKPNDRPATAKSPPSSSWQGHNSFANERKQPTTPPLSASTTGTKSPPPISNFGQGQSSYANERSHIASPQSAANTSNRSPLESNLNTRYQPSFPSPPLGLHSNAGSPPTSQSPMDSTLNTKSPPLTSQSPTAPSLNLMNPLMMSPHIVTSNSSTSPRLKSLPVLTSNLDMRHPPSILSPPVQPSHKSISTSSSSNAPVHSGSYTVTPNRQSCLKSTKAYIPTRGQDTGGSNSVNQSSAPRTRALSSGRPSSLSEVHKAAATTTVAASQISRGVDRGNVPGKDVATYSPPPPLPVSSRFARQQVLPTPPMSPIPDLSPATSPVPRSRSRSGSEKGPVRQRSRSQSTTYSAFPPVSTTTRHMKRDSKASITPSEASDTGVVSPLRRHHRDGSVRNSNSSFTSNSKSSGTDTENVKKITSRNPNANHVKSVSGSMPRGHSFPRHRTVKDSKPAVATAVVTPAPPRHIHSVSRSTISSQGTIKGWTPNATPTDDRSSSPPPIAYTSRSSHHSRSTSTSTTRTVRPEPLNLEKSNYDVSKTSSRSRSNSSSSHWHFSTRTRSRSSSNVPLQTHSRNDGNSFMDTYAQESPVDPNFNFAAEAPHISLQARHGRNQSQSQMHRPKVWQEHELAKDSPLPLQKNYVDDASDECSSSMAESEGSSLAYRDGDGGFAGMLPGIGL